jgi:hypothetical protein
MKIVITIKTDNAAFQDNPQELQEILVDAVEAISQSGRRDRLLFDSYGNKIGNFKVTGK